MDVESSQRSLISSSSSRVGHLQSLEELSGHSSASMGIGDTRYRGWANTRLDRHILDYLLRRGYADTARRMVQGDTSLQALSDVEVGLFSELDTITAALSRGSATQALAWCKDNAAALKKVKSTLEFDLRFQEFIQLARQAKRHEAIAYCRKHLVPSATATSSGSARIRSAMALLAFGPETTCPPYRAMYDISRWNILADTFRRAFLAFYALPPLPLLNLSIWAGLAGLKLPACASSSDKEHNTDCPTCVSSGLGHFATLAHQPQSTDGTSRQFSHRMQDYGQSTSRRGHSVCTAQWQRLQRRSIGRTGKEGQRVYQGPAFREHVRVEGPQEGVYHVGLAEISTLCQSAGENS